MRLAYPSSWVMLTSGLVVTLAASQGVAQTSGEGGARVAGAMPPLFETVPWELGEAPMSNIVFADFDGDGELEIAYQRDGVVTNEDAPGYSSSNANILIRKAHENLTFETISEIGLDPDTRIRHLAASDIDQDGRVDLISFQSTAGTPPPIVTWHRNTELGWAHFPVDPGQEDSLGDVHGPFDFNADGYPDFLIKMFSWVYVCEGSAGGPTGFERVFYPEHPSPPTGEERSYFHTALDLDGDGHDDLVFRMREGSSSNDPILGYYAVFGTGSAVTFVDPTPLSDDPTLKFLSHVKPDDDTFEDRLFFQRHIFVAEQVEIQLPMVHHVLPVTTQTAYESTGDISTGESPTNSPFKFQYVDIDGNGTLDFIDIRKVVFNYRTENETVAPAVRSFATGVHIDVNRDGFKDSINEYGLSLALATSLAPARFATPYVEYYSGQFSEILAADFDGDGDLDLSAKNGVANPSNNSSAVWQTMPSVPQIGEISFMKKSARHPAYALPVYVWTSTLNDIESLHFISLDDPESLAAEQLIADGLQRVVIVEAMDLDHDGFDELATIREDAATGDRSLIIFEPAGSGYQERQSLPVQSEMLSITTGDLNNDGHQDLVLGEREPGPDGAPQVFLYFNNGAGLLLPAVVLETPVPTYWLHAADLDDDGRTDLIGGIDSSPWTEPALYAWVQPETGPPGTDQIVRFAGDMVFGAKELYTGDFDRDGKTDLYVVSAVTPFGANAALLITDPLSPGASGYWSLGWSRNPAGAAEDFNNDGRADLAVAGPTVYLFESLGVAAGECAADLNGDHLVDAGDIGAFVEFFLAGDAAADMNGDGILDIGDIAEFVSLFLAGC